MRHAAASRRIRATPAPPHRRAWVRVRVRVRVRTRVRARARARVRVSECLGCGVVGLAPALVRTLTLT